MHPDRVIVHMYRQSDGLYMRLDYPNTLTSQSSGTNDAPWDPLLGPVAISSYLWSSVTKQIGHTKSILL